MINFETDLTQYFVCLHSSKQRGGSIKMKSKIEPLQKQWAGYKNKDNGYLMYEFANDMINKINELIETVNQLNTHIDRLDNQLDCAIRYKNENLK